MPGHPAFVIPLAAAWSLAALSVVFWIIAATRFEPLRRDPPTVRRGRHMLPPPGGWRRVSVIVPAHDEERVIERCCRSLMAQDHPDFEVIFVLDRCTDRTRAILEPLVAVDPRLRILEVNHCPDDWAGKCNAARRGAEVAAGEWLVFTDADVRFDPELLRAAVALAREDRRQLVSLLSTLTLEHPFERIVQPAASMQLLHQYPIQRINRRRFPRPFANGQFMLFDRDTYDRIGGHAAVKDDLLEDIAFARAVHYAGGSGAVFLADGMLEVSMYDSWPGFRTGWKRIFIEATKRSPRHLRRYAARLAFVGVGLPLAEAACLAGAGVVAAGGEVAIAAGIALPVAIAWPIRRWTLRGCYRLAGADPRLAIWWPLGCLATASIMLAAARDLVRRTPVRWGGREYRLEPGTG